MSVTNRKPSFSLTVRVGVLQLMRRVKPISVYEQRAAEWLERMVDWAAREEEIRAQKEEAKK